MKKGLIAGLGVVILLGSGIYGIHSVSAAGNPQIIETKTNVEGSHAGKRLKVLSQFKEQMHQVNQLKEERLDLKKQAVEKKDTLLDLWMAAKQSGHKEKLKQVKEERKQLKALNKEIKIKVTAGKDDRKALKEAVKKGEGSEQFTKLISDQQAINTKMKEELSLLDQLIAHLI